MLHRGSDLRTLKNWILYSNIHGQGRRVQYQKLFIEAYMSKIKEKDYSSTCYYLTLSHVPFKGIIPATS